MVWCYTGIAIHLSSARPKDLLPSSIKYPSQLQLQLQLSHFPFFNTANYSPAPPTAARTTPLHSTPLHFTYHFYPGLRAIFRGTISHNVSSRHSRTHALYAISEYFINLPYTVITLDLLYQCHLFICWNLHCALLVVIHGMNEVQIPCIRCGLWLPNSVVYCLVCYHARFCL